MSKAAKWCWAVIAVVSATLALFGSAGAEANILGLSVQPFVLVGAWLRALSLSGTAGNALALTLYALLSLAPLIYAAIRKRLSFMPVLTSAYLFFLLYTMVNPSMIGSIFHRLMAGEGALLVQQALLVMLFLMLAASWLLIRAARHTDTKSLTRSLTRLIWWVGALLIVSTAYIELAALKSTIKGLEDAASESMWLLLLPNEYATDSSAEIVLATLRFAASCAPTAVLLYMLPAASGLINGCGRELFAEANVALAQSLTKRARVTILTSVGCMLGLGFLELAFARNVTNTSIVANIPILELLIALASTLFARFMERGCAVYRENQMMI